MARKRVHEIAKAQGVASKELIAALQAAGVEIKAAAASVEETVALDALKSAAGNGATPPPIPPRRPAAASAASTPAKPAPKPDGGSTPADDKPVRPVRPPEGQPAAGAAERASAGGS